ncbi:hypothetical protein LOTGIDRAFT_154505 [Lottia gigantea]|uniref:ZMYM2-like/QRICH1 C-terminal domain-containing protein n=1 Tax=Lottia gigantea TaxID=225164 RepID=V3Z846_LOTGI|nr:hypothetical protein LOTGIDRAFT_154505 [Lottia gigantea]ESO87023.1 hypothetical protein LOTGIDRAFT_154505 [Lottia gigantea]
MKISASKGNDMITKQADIISNQVENSMWMRGILGDCNPKTLLDTSVYLFELNFALRYGGEHRDLTLDQLSVGVNEQESYIKYSEKISKNNQRGLKDFKVVPKYVTAYVHEDPTRCIVKLYERYLQLRPENAATVVYLRPLTKPTESAWYSVVPVGQKTLAKTVQRLYKASGLTGLYTNHSLRATYATRLFRCGVDEQLIAKTTGHRSNAIRQYKRADTIQDAIVSKVIQTNMPSTYLNAN